MYYILYIIVIIIIFIALGTQFPRTKKLMQIVKLSYRVSRLVEKLDR